MDAVAGALNEGPVRLERPAPHVAPAVARRADRRRPGHGRHPPPLPARRRPPAEGRAGPAAVITGAGGTFCSGADLKAVAKGDGPALFTRDGGFAGFTHSRHAKPWIAAIEGFALAGGLEIALACDMRVAAEDARFGLPEARRGLLAAAGGAYRLPAVLPRGIAIEMLATGEPIDAPRALHFGLINRMVAKGEAVASAVELAQRITLSAPLAVREAVALARQAGEHGDDELYRLSHRANKRLWATEDFAEGPRAFVEKREPRWTGR